MDNVDEYLTQIEIQEEQEIRNNANPLEFL